MEEIADKIIFSFGHLCWMGFAIAIVVFVAFFLLVGLGYFLNFLFSILPKIQNKIHKFE